MTPQANYVFTGFQKGINAILKYLLGGENDLQVISVVGMAGAGKTYLAKHLFKESSVVRHFDKMAWCIASQSYQTKDLLLTILNQINPFESDIGKIDDQEELADKLCRSLKRRRYLMVIDDVWDVALWNYLSHYFPNDKTESRILITTRDHNVASETKSKIHQLQALTKEESWELLQKKLPQQEILPKNLVNVAKVVSKSCKGLPLSIVIIGGLLHNAQRNVEMWNQIAKNVTSTILSDPQGKCKDILELSYNHLSSHLKACLLYLGVFPEDHEISVTRLIRLWVAEGLVQGGITSEESVEDVGKRYVNDLISRNLVIPIKEKTEGGVKIFQLHDLLRDFCLEKAKEEHLFTVLDDRGTFDLSLSPRRISIKPDMDKHLPLISLKSVRTVISFCKYNSDGYVERMMKSEHMMLLNVLDMQESTMEAFDLCYFPQLRYLAIWKICRCDQVLVQSALSKLWNLQILILSFFSNHMFEVPDYIFDLVKLRHIHLLPSALFPRHDSKRLEESSVLLENLKSFTKPRLHYGDSNWLSKLPELQKLSCIFFYSSGDILLQQYRFPQLSLCERLTSLKVENGAQRNEIGKLHFPKRLMKLSLRKFKLDSDDISEIGKSLPNLEVLKLHDSVENWSADNEEFPRLKVLKITGGNWYKWDASEGSFPSLEQLWLRSCVSLKRIPLRFGDILCLRLVSIKYCNLSVSESAREIEKIQAEAQNLELKVNLS
ncbi:antimicrobial response protein [Lithospermum erythrorhizon]|uniref:Antimicrobial response protein n=1 Tax=Lithospermum erythrorhizon TaxID=34254 RepID=A0AAV3R671_LITER